MKTARKTKPTPLTSKRTTPAEALALQGLERQIRRKPTEEARGAIRDSMDPEVLADIKHSLNLATGSLQGVDPEAALVYLSFGVENLARLVADVVAKVGAAATKPGRKPAGWHTGTLKSQGGRADGEEAGGAGQEGAARVAP